MKLQFSMAVVGYLAAICLFAFQAAGQSFVYQGELTRAGLLADGPHDFEFRIFPSLAGGIQVGSTAAAIDVPVTDGRFTVEVDAGTGVFTGPGRWLEIATRPSGGGAFTTLTPRHWVAPTPYASRALAEWLTPVDSQTLRMDSTRSRLLLNRSTVVTSAEYFGIRTPTSGVEYGGMYIETESSYGKPFYGLSVGARRAWTYLDGTTGQWRLNLTGFDRMLVTDAGLVGINTPAPAEVLDVGGNVRANDFRYTSPKTHYLSIPAGGFQPTSNQASATIESVSSGTYFAAAVGLASFVAPIQLPDGAVITQIDISVFDNAVGALSGKLGVRSFGAFGYNTNVVTGNSSNNGNTQTLTMTPNLTVNNLLNSYVLTVDCGDWQGSGTAIFGARVTYTVGASD